METENLPGIYREAPIHLTSEESVRKLALVVFFGEKED